MHKEYSKHLEENEKMADTSSYISKSSFFLPSLLPHFTNCI
jgi:hypothetical protein